MIPAGTGVQAQGRRVSMATDCGHTGTGSRVAARNAHKRAGESWLPPIAGASNPTRD
jgi:hypothetical protein